MPTSNQIEAYANELLADRLDNDHDCVYGALSNLIVDVLALINSDNIDDTLALKDQLKAKLHAQIIEDANLWDEAEDALNGLRESSTKMFQRENASMFAG